MKNYKEVEIVDEVLCKCDFGTGYYKVYKTTTAGEYLLIDGSRFVETLLKVYILDLDFKFNMKKAYSHNVTKKP